MYEFITNLIINVIMLNRSDENVNKLSLLDLNVINFLMYQNISNFLLN